MSLKNVGKWGLLVKLRLMSVHFNRSIGLGYHSILKINWGSFRGRREEKWGLFRGRFQDHFSVGDHFGVGIISGAVQLLLIYLPLQLRRRIFHIGQNCNPRWLPVYLANIWVKQLESQHSKVHQEFVAENHSISRDRWSDIFLGLSWHNPGEIYVADWKSRVEVLVYLKV